MSIPARALANPFKTAPRGSRMGLVAFMIMLLLATVAIPAISQASDFRSGDEIKVNSSARIEGDIYYAAGTLEFDGQVSGDATFAAGQAKIRGEVGGSLTLLAGNGTISGTVRGSVKVLGGNITISGQVDGDVVVAGGQVKLGQASQVNGDVVLAGGSIELQGEVGGDVRGIGQNTVIDGTINGDVHLQTNRLTVEDGTQIRGELNYGSAVEANIDRQARIEDGITRTGDAPWQSGQDFLGPLLRVVWALVVGAILIGLAPRLASLVAEKGRDVVQSFGVGIVCAVLIPIGLALLLVSVAGIAAAFIGLSFFLVIAYLSQVVAGLALGHLILPNSWNDGSRGYNLLAMVIGVLIIAALGFLPIPFLGSVVTAFVTLWGIGAAFSIFADLTPRPQPAPSA